MSAYYSCSMYLVIVSTTLSNSVIGSQKPSKTILISSQSSCDLNSCRYLQNPKGTYRNQLRYTLLIGSVYTKVGNLNEINFKVL